MSNPTVRNPLRLLVGFSLLGLFTSVAVAGELYRCESTAGSVSYQQTPCADASKQQVRSFEETPRSNDGLTVDTTAKIDPIIAADESANATAQGTITAVPQQSNAPMTQIDPQPQGRHAAWRCSRSDGSFYFSIQACGNSTVYGDAITVREVWSATDPREIRGGVFVSPNTVINPFTGETVPFDGQVFSRTYQPQHLEPDQGVVVNRRQACKEARYEADVQRRENSNLGFDGRRALDDQVWDMCNGTRKIELR